MMGRVWNGLYQALIPTMLRTKRTFADGPPASQFAERGPAGR